MQKISDLIERFRNFQNKDQRVKDTLVYLIKKNTGIKIESKDIKINGVIAKIVNNQNIKIKIFMKKEVILNEMKETLGNKAPRDIV